VTIFNTTVSHSTLSTDTVDITFYVFGQMGDNVMSLNCYLNWHFLRFKVLPDTPISV